MGVNSGLDKTFAATTATIVKNFAVIMGAEDYCSVPDANNTAKFLGLAQDTAAAVSDAISVRIAGVGLATAYSTFSVGDRLYVYDTAGRLAVIPTNATPSYYNQVAVALEAATATGNVVEVLIDKQERYS